MGIIKPVSFKDKEQDLLDYIEDKNFSYYVKSLIREDMKKHIDKLEDFNLNKYNNIRRNVENKNNNNNSEIYNEEFELSNNKLDNDKTINMEEEIKEEPQEEIEEPVRKRKYTDFEM